MARARAKTADRGYGGPHQKLKEQWRPAVDAGQTFCHAGICLEERDGRTRWIPPGAPWHLGHTPDRTGWTGPEHQRCGAADGARRGNRAQPRLVLAAGRDVICTTCGKPYHYAAQACEVCGVHYHPSGKTVRTCSRTCGVQLRRRIYGHAGKSAPRPKPPPQPHVTYVRECQQCGEPFTARKTDAKFCSLKCRNASRFPSLRYCACGQQLLPGRHKCDDCNKAKKAAENREYAKRRHARAADNAMATSRTW